MREKLKQLKPIQNMMVLALLALLFVLTTQTSAIGQTLCDGRMPTIVGTAGHDEINGTAGPDIIHGLGGNDIIRGLGGNDVICGGDGQDVIGGGYGNDIVFGENGYDSIWGGHGDDILRGGDGNDNISGGSSGNDRLYGDNGNDNLYGRSGVDELYGGEGTENNDSCYDEAGTFITGCEQFNGDYIPPAPVPKTYAEADRGVEWPDPRFTDNGDGTVIDHLTGLIWLKNANCFGERNWFEAKDDSNNLADGQCGLTDGSRPGDWFLPNVRELYSLLATYPGNDNLMLPDGHPFVGAQSDYRGLKWYWTSTGWAVDYTPPTGWGWSVNGVDINPFPPGYIRTIGFDSYYHDRCRERDQCPTHWVWPVRGGN